MLKINVRSFDEKVGRHTLDAIERIVNAEAQASGAPRMPEITTTEHYPLTVNDAGWTDQVGAALRAHFGDGNPFSIAEAIAAVELTVLAAANSVYEILALLARKKSAGMETRCSHERYSREIETT